MKRSRLDRWVFIVAPKFEGTEILWLAVMVVAIMGISAFAIHMLGVHLIANL